MENRSRKPIPKRLTGRLAALAVVAMLMLALLAGAAGATSPGGFAGVPSSSSVLTSIAGSPAGGVWVQQDDAPVGAPAAGTYTYGEANAFTSIKEAGVIAAVPGRAPGYGAYHIVSRYGNLWAQGPAATQLCGGKLSSCSGFPSNPKVSEQIVAAAATPSGRGLWAVGRDGKVWTAGDAISDGDVQRDKNVPIAIFGTPSGKGYTIGLSDGGVYTFGDAKFFGSTGGKKPGGHNATGLTPSYDASGNHNGYWMVADDGGVYTFGAAPFLGSTGGDDGGSKVTGITTLGIGGHGYAWVHADGKVGYSAHR
jgi:hypothetical protein